MKISLIFALFLTGVDRSNTFAPSKSTALKRSSPPLFSKSNEDDLQTNTPRSVNQMNDSLISARTARIAMPLAAILSLALPKAALAKASSSQFDATIKTYFPGSIPSTTVLLRVQSTLRKRQYLPYNTLLATSLSSDEIVNTPASIINLLRNKLSESKDGGVYSLGGLGGIPFTGDAGMDDLLSHAPKDGKIVILFGSQVSTIESHVYVLYMLR